MNWGTILGGMGALAGVGADIFGKDQDTYHPEVWRNDMYKNKLQEVRALRDAANQYGFHPLALLGMGSSGGFAQPVDGDSGSHLGDVMSGAARAFSDLGVLYESDQDRIERAQERADRNDAVERARMDQIAADTIASGEREDNRRLREAEIRRLESETMVNVMQAARSRSELASLNRGPVGAIGPGASSLPRSVTFPYIGKMNIKPGSSSAAEIQDLLGEPWEWWAAAEHFMYNLLNPDPSTMITIPAPVQGPRASGARRPLPY